MYFVLMLFVDWTARQMNFLCQVDKALMKMWSVVTLAHSAMNELAHRGWGLYNGNSYAANTEWSW